MQRQAPHCSVCRAARLVQERWRHHKMLRLQLAVKAVIRIQAWVRGYKASGVRGRHLPWLEAEPKHSMAQCQHSPAQWK